MMSRSFIGVFAIFMAVAFNAPYAILVATFDYPDILRGPASDTLLAFSAGGGGLILTWHAFALTAIALAPLAFALSLTPERVARTPALAIGAAILGALAGLTQAMGFWRWVFVVPGLAETYASDLSSEAQRVAAISTFDLMNAFGGVEIGEHIGQLLTAGFVALMATLQWRERAPVSAGLGIVASAMIAVGTGEGLAMALGQDGEIWRYGTIGGFLVLSAWLIATGVGYLRGAPVSTSARLEPRLA